MFETTISYLAWIVVVLVQAIVHLWIFGTPRNRVDDTLSVTAVKRDDPNDNDMFTLEHQRQDSAPCDQSVPQTIPHMQISEDEFEEEPEQESFDGDEPLIFFELLEKTGSELMKVSMILLIYHFKLFGWFTIAYFVTLHCYVIGTELFIIGKPSTRTTDQR
jgi:hypothetical protein